MPTYYALQQQGVADGTVNPSLRADARQVYANVANIIASKPGTQALAIADKLYLGKLRAGSHLRRIFMTTDTSWGTGTISIGTLALPAKYVNAATLTVVNTPTSLPVLASTLDDGPLTADEDLYLTLGGAAVGAAVLSTLDIELAYNN